MPVNVYVYNMGKRREGSTSWRLNRCSVTTSYIVQLLVVFSLSLKWLPLEGIGMDSTILAIDFANEVDTDMECTFTNNSFIWVTAYFTTPGSKHSISNYVTWISNFIRQFRAPLFFFTTPYLADFYRKRVPNDNVHYITKYENIWQVSCVAKHKEVYINQRIRSNDPEGKEDLYAMWNAKVCFVKDISDSFRKSIIFWIDCGSMREFTYTTMPFPNNDRLMEVYPDGTTSGQMVFAMFKRVNMTRQSTLSFVSFAWAIGGFFAGDRRAIRRFYEKFWEIHDVFARQNESVGTDQYIFSTYMLYFGKSWVQPNYAAGRCDTWFSTFSFYGDLRKCAWEDTELHPVTEYIIS